MNTAGPLLAALAAAIVASSAQARAETPAPLSSFKDCPACPEMVALPAGRFLMGASPEDRKFTYGETMSSELPQHQVDIGYSFAVSRFEISVADFAAYVAETGARTGGECEIRTPDLGPDAGQFVGTLTPGAPHMPGLVVIVDGDFRSPGTVVSAQYPATCISRREALAYLAWLGKKSGRAYRFPTEAEWEYATRAGSTTPFHYGGGFAELCRYGNFADRKSPYSARVAAQCAENPSPTALAPVGSYLPNAWGLHDIIGNAFEFTEDCATENYHGAPVDGSPWRTGECDYFTTRSYFFDSVGSGLRSAARCTVVDWDSRSNGLAIRAAVSLDDAAWDRQR